MFNLQSAYKPTGDQPQAIAELLRGGKNQVLMGVTGSGKSLTYDEPILVYEQKSLKPQLIPIGKFVEEYSIINNQYLVPSINPNTNQQELKLVTSLQRHKSPKLLYELTTKCGRKVKITGDHNFFVLRNGNLVLIKTTDIKNTDHLPIPRSIESSSQEFKEICVATWINKKQYFLKYSELTQLDPMFKKIIKERLDKQKLWRVINNDESISLDILENAYNNKLLKKLTIFPHNGTKHRLYQTISNELLRILGLYVSEGHSSNGYLLFSVHEKSLQKIFLKDVSKIFVNNGERRCNPGDFQINDRFYLDLFSNWCGKTAGNKHLPPWFLNLSQKQLGLLLSSIFSGDGYVNSQEVALISKSNQLISELSYAFLRFGIITRIREKYKRATNVSNSEKSLYFEIIISGQDNLIKYAKNIGFTFRRKQVKLLKLLSLKRSANTNVDLIPLSGNSFKEFRLSHKLSQSQLANKIGCTRSHISFVESGKRHPSFNLVQRLATIYRPEFKSLLNVFWTPIKKIESYSNVNNNYVYDISVEDNETFIAGFGGLFVHNTFTMANVIAKLQKPTLIISHNKTLAAQLYQEFKEYFPDNAVSYFVSYYDYYQPEAYIPQSDTYIEKETDINEEIDKMRLAATANLLTRKDVIIIASVSCIYNLGNPVEYGKSILPLKVGAKIARNELLLQLNDLQYTRNDFSFVRGSYRIRGDIVDIYLAYEDKAVRIHMPGSYIEKLEYLDPLTGQSMTTNDNRMTMNDFIVFPAKHFQPNKDLYKKAFAEIQQDLEAQVTRLKAQSKILEAHRLQQRVTYDLEMIAELGYVNGIENYSRYFDGRNPGDAPFSLLDYFPKDYLTIIDESHITVPQIRGMYNGDRSRKQTLIDFGFRLPSALDNRPLRFEEFQRRLGQTVYVSATPNEWEISQSENKIVEQVIRPTGLVDPKVTIRPTLKQINDLEEEITKRVNNKQRVLVTTLTKRMAEDLSTYLDERGYKVHYLHSDIDTLERLDVLSDLRKGVYDVVVGINLLREGLDLPEVSLVAILDADKEGFLRSRTSLIQTMGRAARHVEGEVIMYADRVTDSMKAAIDEVERRRNIQIEYNKKHKITPQTITKAIRDRIVIAIDPKQVLKNKKILDASDVDISKVNQLTPEDKSKLIKLMTRQMNTAAKQLDFELAARIRDRIKEITKEN